MYAAGNPSIDCATRCALRPAELMTTRAHKAGADSCPIRMSMPRAAALRPAARGIDILIGQESAPALCARVVINSAGLNAHRVAQSIEGFPAAYIPKISYAK